MAHRQHQAQLEMWELRNQELTPWAKTIQHWVTDVPIQCIELKTSGSREDHSERLDTVLQSNNDFNLMMLGKGGYLVTSKIMSWQQWLWLWRCCCFSQTLHLPCWISDSTLCCVCLSPTLVAKPSINYCNIFETWPKILGVQIFLCCFLRHWYHVLLFSVQCQC